MDEPKDSPPGLFVSLKRLWRTLLVIAENRLELILVEVEEERRRAFEALLLTVVLGVVGAMTLLMATLTVVVIFWDTHRLVVLAGLSVLYLLATVAAYWRLRRRLNHWSLFSASLAEFKRDKACLEEKE
jgi:uncharacterized membrane protein YqjE